MAGLLFIFIFFCSVLHCDGIQCMNCQDVPYPHDCTAVTECRPDEFCYTEKIVSNSGTVTYNTGCLSKLLCSAVDVSIVGKRSGYSRQATDLSICAECCPDDFCNIKGCQSPEIPIGQRGPYCFSCNAVLDPKSCEKVEVCSQNEVCLLYAPVEYRGLPERVFRSQCEKQSTCHGIATSISQDSCSGTCCTTDFCNNQCTVSTEMTTETTSNITLATSMTTVLPLQNITMTTGFVPTANITTDFVLKSSTLTTGTISQSTSITETEYATHVNLLDVETWLSFDVILGIDVCQTANSIADLVSTPLLVTSKTFHCHHGNGYVNIHNPHAQLCVHIVAHHATWSEARSQCRTEGADLVVLDTHEKAVLLRHILTSKSEYDHSSYWIGAKDASNNNHFSWVNHAGLHHSETDWDRGQPDSHTSSNTEDCVAMVRSAHFKWHDRQCSDQRNFICERNQ